MKIKISILKTIICLTFVLILSSNFIYAENSTLSINNTKTNAELKDDITYSFYISDIEKPVACLDIILFYNADYLKLNKKTIAMPNIQGISTDINDGKIHINAINFKNGYDFKNKNLLITMDFNVLQTGKTNITYVIKSMYDTENIKTLKQVTKYKTSYNLSVNGKPKVENEIPEIEKEKNIGKVVFNNTYSKDEQNKKTDNDKKNIKTTTIPSINKNTSSTLDEGTKDQAQTTNIPITPGTKYKEKIVNMWINLFAENIILAIIGTIIFIKENKRYHNKNNTPKI